MPARNPISAWTGSSLSICTSLSTCSGSAAAKPNIAAEIAVSASAVTHDIVVDGQHHGVEDTADNSSR